jgi:hypothetical protein
MTIRISFFAIALGAALVGLTTTGCTAADPELEDAEDDGDDGDDADGDEDVGVTSSELAAGSRDHLWPGTAGRFNLWDDHGYSDTHVARESHDSSFLNDGFNDKASSFVNKTNRIWKVYVDAGYENMDACVRPHHHATDLKDWDYPFGGSWGDKISSIKRMPRGYNTARCFRFIGNRN